MEANQLPVVALAHDPRLNPSYPGPAAAAAGARGLAALAKLYQTAPSAQTQVHLRCRSCRFR
jgi:hypothetical protein